MPQKEIELAKLIVDETLYPRTRVNAYNVRCIREAIAAGEEVPPIVVDQKNRIVDGRHRYENYLPQLKKDPKFTVTVEVRRFKTDADFFLAAARLNASHGQRMTPVDRIHFALRAKELGVSTADIGKAINMKESDVKEMFRDRVASAEGGTFGAIKTSIKHLKGQRLSNDQWAANTKLSGMPLRFHATQIGLFIENDFVDLEGGRDYDALTTLFDVLGAYLASAAPKNVA